MIGNHLEASRSAIDDGGWRQTLGLIGFINPISDEVVRIPAWIKEDKNGDLDPTAPEHYLPFVVELLNQGFILLEITRLAER